MQHKISSHVNSVRIYITTTYIPSTVKICDASYHGTKEEKIASRDCFFESNVVWFTTCIFSNRDEPSSEVVVRLCEGCKMLNMHDLGRYKWYSIEKAYLNESSKIPFKGELRMQTYIDIIKPSCLEGIFFLNICGRNKAHIVAHVSIQ